MSNPKSQVSDSSTSLLSELPDIKKWFPSYTYQSPVLDTNEEFCFSVGVEDEEKRLQLQNIENEKEGIYEDFTKVNQSNNCKSTGKAGKHDIPSPSNVKIPVYPDSLSQPSEPPDITKWFPSYVYESPVLDSADFAVSLSSGYTSEEDHHLKELPVTKVKDEILSCTKNTTRHCRVDSSNKNSSTTVLVSDKDSSERSNLSPKDNLFHGSTSNQKTVRTELNVCNTVTDKPVVSAKSVAEDLLPVVQDDNAVGLLGSPAKKFRAAENNSCWISLDHKRRKEDCRSMKKEQGKFSCENQFISVNNKARSLINKENSPVKSVCSFDEKKVGMLRREILKETTNFDCSRVPEVAGKWRCPQKNKPHIGPPLKQLRLEKWVHKK